MKTDRFRIGVVIGLAILLAALTWSIRDKQAIAAEGRTVLLETAPADPRALLMGDYMQLAYKESREFAVGDLPRRGLMVLRIDTDGVGHVARPDDGKPLAENEVRVAYRLHRPWRWSPDQLFIAPDRFYFSEGSAERYQAGRYGILKIDAAGRLLLVGLADEKRQPIPAQ